jgi:hypothetical protein
MLIGQMNPIVTCQSDYDNALLSFVNDSLTFVTEVRIDWMAEVDLICSSALNALS